MPAATAFFTRKRLAWHAWLDMPVALTPPHAAAAGLACEVLLGEPGLCYDGPYAADAVPGWLVLLGISNPGWMSVRGTDFADPLTFSFPGRQVRSAQISPEPAGRTAARPASPPAIRLLAANSPQSRPGDRSPARMQLTGDFLLRPGDGYTVTLLLSGTPAPHSRIRQDGSLTDGKILTGPDGNSTRPWPA